VRHWGRSRGRRHRGLRAVGGKGRWTPRDRWGNTPARGAASRFVVRAAGGAAGGRGRPWRRGGGWAARPWRALATAPQTAWCTAATRGNVPIGCGTSPHTSPRGAGESAAPSVVTPQRVKSRAAPARFHRPRNARRASWVGACANPAERRRLSQRLSTAESLPKGPSESASAATSPANVARAPSRPSVASRACAFVSPSLHPMLARGQGDTHPVVPPQVPAGGTGGHARCDAKSHRQIDPARGGLTPRWRQIRQGRLQVLRTFRPVRLGRRDHEIRWTPYSEMPQGGPRPLGLRVPRGRVTTAWTRWPLVVATRGDDLWRWQVCQRGNPFSGIGSIGTRTKHSFAFLVRMLEPKLSDTIQAPRRP
jgi:hypothetical protein